MSSTGRSFNFSRGTCRQNAVLGKSQLNRKDFDFNLFDNNWLESQHVYHLADFVYVLLQQTVNHDFPHRRVNPSRHLIHRLFVIVWFTKRLFSSFLDIDKHQCVWKMATVRNEAKLPLLIISFETWLHALEKLSGYLFEPQIVWPTFEVYMNIYSNAIFSILTFRKNKSDALCCLLQLGC